VAGPPSRARGGHGVHRAVLEPVWQELEGHCELALAQAHSNRAPQGRKRDFADAERLLRRHVAGELILSFVPNPEQRLWRTMTRSKHQLTRDRVRIHSQLESLLEDGRIKLSGWVSDLLGVSSQRMLRALAEGETDPAKLAAMADPNLRATPEQLQDALSAARTLSPMHRSILGCFWPAGSHRESDPGSRRDGGSGLARPSGRRTAAGGGPRLRPRFRPAGDCGSGTYGWVVSLAGAAFLLGGNLPGREESAEVSRNNRSPKGNRMMRRVLTQVANAAVKSKGSVFQNLYRKLVPRLGHNKAIWAIAHRLCRLTWKILHQGVRYIEFGNRPNPRAVQKRAAKLLRELRNLGYQVQLQPQSPAAPS